MADRADTTPKARRIYGEMRDFTRTPEPRPAQDDARATGAAPIFVVQKHDASHLHWDFRLEHDGVLWSWAVPKGPSLDPHDKRLAMHVEDHPVEYASFEGIIPEGNYGAGTVEIWDRGTWAPVEADAAAALAKGELKFRLDGERLHGGFVLVRLKPRPREKAESWLLIKEHDAFERDGADATALEATPLGTTEGAKPAGRRKVARKTGTAALPEAQEPQLAQLVRTPPTGEGWISEVKFDGYRMLARKDGDQVRIITRNGLDWTDRLPAFAEAVAAMQPETLMLDGELVALAKNGVSSFSALQDAFSTGRTRNLLYYAFDLLHLDGIDMRPKPLSERRDALEQLLQDAPASGPLRFSEHLASDAARVKQEACAIGLEGIICKRLDAPYRPGRGRDWVKVKCGNREEFVILGYTPPGGTRQGLGSLQLGFHDEAGQLYFIGGCGTGFSGKVLKTLTERLETLQAGRPGSLLGAEKPPRDTIWVKPELVAELSFAGFTGGGMLRHASFLGLREDKPADEVVRPVPPSDAERIELGSGKAPASRAPASRAKPAAAEQQEAPAARSNIVVAKSSERGAIEIGGQRISHADRVLWPASASGDAITKRDLAEYWQAIGDVAAPGIVGRPLAFVRCPDGIEGEQFFQKHLGRGMPAGLHEAEADGAPYVAIAETAGLIGAAQIAALELHSWGSSEADPLHADRLVFDLDPGDGVAMPTIVEAALEVKQRLEAVGLAAFCRTSGGKGLHVVAPVETKAGWDDVRAWCRAFAESMEADAPDRFISTTRKKDRDGRILVDWLRNGLGSTAIASFSPRARPGAGVATPLAWREVTEKLDPQAFNLRTVPSRLARQKTDPWDGFEDAARDLPGVAGKPVRRKKPARSNKEE
ncbi:DNA ligase D [Lichenicola sp.]|uniref:DNA ligase D n=1 Tax=Lichenicola sp. TaxID=2804529 RepID=UPI003AFFEF86